MLRTRQRQALLLFPLLPLALAACGSAGPPVTQTRWIWDSGRALDLAPTDLSPPMPRFRPAAEDQVPSAAQLTGPLILLDLRGRVAQSRAYQATVADLDAWQARHGEMPRGAVVLVLTGWVRGWQGDPPDMGEEFLRQLCDRFSIRGVATDLPSLGPAALASLAQGQAWLVTGLVHREPLEMERGRMVVAPFPDQSPEWPVRVFLFLPRGAGRR